jgi:hypothetical protein
VTFFDDLKIKKIKNSFPWPPKKKFKQRILQIIKKNYFLQNIFHNIPIEFATGEKIKIKIMAS